MAATDGILKTLRKCFQQAAKVDGEWAKSTAELQRAVGLVCNVLSKMQLTKTASTETLGVLAQFEGIRDKLIQKHIEQLEILLRVLQASK
jgi:hypothetical protein